MTTAFADTSAIVKLYADEEGHREIRALPVLVISALAWVEVPATLWRKQRMGELSADDASVLAAQFNSEIQIGSASGQRRRTGKNAPVRGVRS